MTEAPSCVLDASALLAYLQDENGAERVEAALAKTAAISALSWAETLSKLSDARQDPAAVVAELTEAGILGAALRVHPVDERLALEIAILRAPTRKTGLSFGDRACLALGRVLKVPVLTTDLAWSKLRLPGVSVEVVR